MKTAQIDHKAKWLLFEFSTRALTVALAGLVTGNALATISMDFVTVGNPDNSADLATGYGSVGYIYGIGKYEVTLAQYTAFLNAVASADTHALYNPSMGTKLYIAGISQSGVAGSYSYSVIGGSGNRPVTFVSWFDAARFANWMHNGQPVGSQTSATTENGAYTLNGATSGVFFRNAGARYSIPSEDEWYKAAYYDSSLNSGNGGYWLYPTRSNAQPNSRNGSTTDPNSANYYFDDSIANGFNGGYAVTDSTGFSSSQNYLTEVGAFALASSFYGTFDQGGNVWEWNDGVSINSAGRGLRGGSWFSGFEEGLRATYRSTSRTDYENFPQGFRIVNVPEPSGISLVILGIVLLAWSRKHALSF